MDGVRLKRSSPYCATDLTFAGTDAYLRLPKLVSAFETDLRADTILTYCELGDELGRNRGVKVCIFDHPGYGV